MTQFERFQRNRAYESKAWFDSEEYKTIIVRDKKLRADRDRSLGHVPECTLTKCASNCTRGRI